MEEWILLKILMLQRSQNVIAVLFLLEQIATLWHPCVRYGEKASVEERGRSHFHLSRLFTLFAALDELVRSRRLNMEAAASAGGSTPNRSLHGTETFRNQVLER